MRDFIEAVFKLKFLRPKNSSVKIRQVYIKKTIGDPGKRVVLIL
jgi:hypothetical protein